MHRSTGTTVTVQITCQMLGRQHCFEPSSAASYQAIERSLIRTRRMHATAR